MPRINPIQTSFALGEISPRMLARVDTKAYQSGAQGLENMIPLAQGPMRRRSGINFAQELVAGQLQCKLVPYPISADDYLILAFYDLKLVVFNKFGEVIAPELVLNPSFSSGPASWTPFSPGGATVTFSLVAVTLNPALTPGNAAVRQLVTGLTIGSAYRLRVTQLAPLRSMRLRVGNVAGGGEVGTIIGSSQTVVFNFVPTATSHWIEVAAMTPSVLTVVDEISVQSTTIPPVPLTSPFAAASLGQIQYEMDPAGTALYLVNGVNNPQKFTFTPPSTFVLADAVFVGKPAVWTGTNQPRTLTFYQGRFWLGGTFNEPSTFWGSKSSVYLNFTLGTLADDGLAYTIAKRGPIRWMSGLKALLIGTETQELAVSSEGPVITPTDIKLEPQSTYGSSPIQPALLGNQVLYASADGRKLYSMGYRFEESGWVSTDLAFAAEHITGGRLIAQSFAQNPENILWFADGQGRLLGCSYDRGNSIVGWHRHPTPMIILSVCTVKFLGTDISWFAYRIDRGGIPFVQLGLMSAPIGSGVYMDAAKRVSVTTATTHFDGWQHLAGYTVKVLVDGAVHPDVVVAPDGSIDLQLQAYEVLAGLPAPAKFRSMPVEATGQQATQQAMKRSNRIFLQLLDSCRPKINGVRPPDRRPSTPMNTREPNRTELIFVSNLGWDRQEVINVEEDLPLDVAIGGIYLEMAEEQP